MQFKHIAEMFEGISHHAPYTAIRKFALQKFPGAPQKNPMVKVIHLNWGETTKSCQIYIDVAAFEPLR